jgi:hypothetical protein
MRRYHHGRRNSGIIAAFLLLKLGAVYILRHEQIDKWLLEHSEVFGTKLISTNDYSSPLCLTNPEQIPAYSGKLYTELNDNIPSFTDYDLTHPTYLSPLEKR